MCEIHANHSVLVITDHTDGPGPHIWHAGSIHLTLSRTGSKVKVKVIGQSSQSQDDKLFVEF